MRRNIVAGNWKMNGSLSFAREFSESFLSAARESGYDPKAKSTTVIIAPPATLLHSLGEVSKDSFLELSAQNVSPFESGAYTGEVSVDMLGEAGCDWCLVGHSERRTLFAETDADVLAKVKALIASGIKPIVCVGETLDERESGSAESVVSQQVEAVFDNLDEAELENVVIAYEPVWAIGTGKTASPEQAQAMHKCIRQVVANKSAELAEAQVILYGGSVNAKNAAELFAQEDIDGGLVGGASLKALDFLEICRAI